MKHIYNIILYQSVVSFVFGLTASFSAATGQGPIAPFATSGSGRQSLEDIPTHEDVARRDLRVHIKRGQDRKKKQQRKAADREKEKMKATEQKANGGAVGAGDIPEGDRK